MSKLRKKLENSYKTKIVEKIYLAMKETRQATKTAVRKETK